MSESTEATGRPAILVVDDAPFFRQTLREQLEAQGYPVIEAASGEEVVDLVVRHAVSAVLTDLNMPEVSGQELLRRVKRLRPELPVIVFSAQQDFDAVREVLRDGALEYLVKPISPGELLQAVARAEAVYAAAQRTAQDIQEAQRRLSDLVLLKEIGTAATTEDNLQLLLDKILDLVRDALQVEVISLMLVEADGLLHIRSSRGLPADIVARTRVAPGQGVSGHVWATGREVLLEDIQRDGRFPARAGEVHYSTHSVLSMPIRLRDQVVGVLNVNNKQSGEHLSASDRDLLNVIAQQTALAIENFKLVSSLRQQARELVKANRSLQRLNRARARLVFNLSNELKAPLDAIREVAETLLQYGNHLQLGARNDYLTAIMAHEQQLQRMLTGMLCLFSLESGGGELELSSFALDDLLTEALNARADEVALSGLRVVLTRAHRLDPVYADRGKVLTMIEALLDNAIRYNRQNGEIRIRLENAVTNGLGNIYLQLSNDGQTITPESAPEIFAQNIEVERVRSTENERVGIGLPLCRAIAERLGGKIFLEPAPGEGTTIGLLLPTRESYGVEKHVQ